MSMKKAFDQTIRDIKREVNKKVLKVPSIEQKVLDATSNEPWGPHGSLLADIAQATRNYHEYQMIISVIWKRINDTGKNWRHVYKALTVLEYLVAHGSERVIDEIKEHAYQISTLSDFQYIDSGGRDQGNNVRRKSQSLVLLVNDKERILEVRQKAAANREKFRSTSAVGGMYRPSSYSGSGGYGDRYDDDRYVGRDDERNGYGREREWSSRDDDRYGRYGDSYTRDGDRHSRDSEERYGKDSYRDDEYRGRSPKVDDYQYGSRSRSADKDKDHSYDDDDRQSSRGSSVKGEDHPQDGRRVERKFPEQNAGAPPSYEEAVGGSRSPAYSERDGDAPAASAPKSSSPPTSASPSQNTASWSPVNPEADTFDAFDPRGPVTGSSAVAGAAPVASSNAEMDLFGSLSDSFSSNPLAVVPVTSAPVTAGINSSNTADINSVPFTGNQSFEDPFGDSPFKAISSSDEIPAQTHNLASPSVLQPTSSIEQTHPVAQKVETVSNLDFSDTFPGLTYYTTDIPNSQQSLLNSHSTPQEPLPNQNDDILAGILPPPEPSLQTASQSAYHAPAGQPAQPNYGNISNYIPESGPAANYGPQSGPEINYMQQSVPAAAGVSPMASQNPAMSSAQLSNSLPQPVSGSAVSSNINRTQSYAVHQQNNDFLDSYSSQAGESITLSSQPVRSSSTGSLALVAQQPAKDKFEPKSAVWADTLNRGLVNLNISGAKVNPLSDIGIDFEALNRKEKRMEKPSATPSTSNIPMGKAMGSGSGIGRAGVGAHRAPLNPMMGGMGMGGGPSMGMGMGGYGGMNQSMGMGTGGYGGQNPSMGLGTGGYGGMHMGMGPGAPMQSASGYPPAANMPSGYNPMLGRGGYPPQQPYGGGYQ